ncbi:MAG TPA: hypothetical protein VNT81_16290 [Vicinamibacterales bacterium]|nr:hypothetical protein [Vicinamibacterales bacterium]
MATSRCRHAVLLIAAISLACMSRESVPHAAPIAQDKIEKLHIQHLTPRPDFVGPLPTRLEWTAVEGADHYAIGVENEIEIPVFDQDGIKGTSVAWPTGLKIEAGTYYWRVVGLKGNRLIADSGRAAFVVRE